MPIKTVFKPIVLASVLIAAAALAQTPYDEGQKALREQRWTEAAEQFDQAAQSDREQADSAIYWKAYALFKSGRNKEAERALRTLERKYPESSWIKESQALRMEYQDPARTLDQAADSGEVMDEELRLFALAQLMDRNPERALPLLLDLLNHSESASVRQDALFVLAMSDEPAALETLATVARGNGDSELQASAIHILGNASPDYALPLLEELYQNNAAPEVKQAVIQAYLVSDEPEQLIRILNTESDPELQQQIIHTLGAMDATTELEALYPGLQDPQLKVAVIDAFAIAGDQAMLRRVLETETAPEIRQAALHGIAMDGGDDSAAFLESVYKNTGSSEEKSTVIEAMMIMDDAEGLIRLLKQESDPEFKRQILQMMTIMDSEAAEQYLFEQLEKSQ